MADIVWYAISGLALGFAFWAWRLVPGCWPRHPWDKWEVLQRGQYHDTKHHYLVQERTCPRCGTHALKKVDY